jgi:linoleoyl-CoA desaturase
MYTNLKFQRKDPKQFFSTLHRRVNDYFKENNKEKTANAQMIVKTISMFAIYLIPYFLLLFGAFPLWAVLGLYAVMGLGKAGVGFSVMHDANHGSFSKYQIVNNLLSHSMEMVGGSSFTWKVQHNLLHHTYTNIYQMDEDIHDKPILRLSPYGELKKIHRYQHWYASFLYSLATLGWVFKKDFSQLNTYNKNGITEKAGSTPQKEWVRLIVGKVLYLTIFLVIPLVVLNVWWHALIGFFIMHMIAGFIVTVIFQLAHVVEGPSHHEPDPSGTMDSTWAIHQLKTTANFARRNPLITWYVGGLNYQIEHHLFPHICHIHYKRISDIVKKTAMEYNLPYYDNPSFWRAVGSHFRVLKQFGQGKPAIA